MCLDGEKDNGYKYIKDAVKNGAVLILADRKVYAKIPTYLCHNPRIKMAQIAKKLYNNPDDKLFIIGVTGTNGKTTTTHLLKEIFINSNQNIATIGTNGCYYNYCKTEDSFTTSTTPEACDLFRIFANMQRLGATKTVMEVSSHSLSQERVYNVNFDVGIFTNLTPDHLDYHNNMENYFLEKKKLFQMAKLCIINVDDEYGRRLYDEFGYKSISYGINEACDFRAKIIKATKDGTYFDILGKKDNIYINIPGKFSVYNALCSYACATRCGVNEDIIVKSLENTKGVLGRFEKVNTDTDYSVIIDYAHSPDSLENVLKTAREFTKGRVIALFGCGGNRDMQKRPIMGKISGEYADFTIVTSDNPRFEKCEDIIFQIEEGIKETNGDYIIIKDRREAIEYALDFAQKDDTVLLLGKGNENYIINRDKKTYFCEKEEVFKIIKKKGQKENA